ncbi:AAA family ATPase [Burkholderia stagnalis]|uniref:AAA family ATPase n=1 Tax=Burkholderia stagnalis TaxID=1503054 RepID=UPI0007532930|nr:AAA family ATPase [Burkholderia stagnalis]KVO60794.1 helicase [Burkholderia stagnalis]KVP08825.1 helicase [Burkholderia stagnalis]KVW90361.1 helicase [Burkholderia stagnalis]KWH72333.1 helicase [Burkholderia stagnalis]KWK20643.1 helicase [Burkholderia stagnalis]
MMNGHDDARAREALFALDAGCAREEWVRVAMAAKAAGLPEDDFLDWSATGANYGSERDARSVWKSVKPDGGIGPGTLFKMAKDAGWNGAPRALVSSHAVTAQPGAQAAPKPRFDVAAAFASYPPASADHPYIVAKRGNPAALRVVPSDDPQTVAGKSVCGYLVVPAYSLDGQLRTVQYVPPPGQGKKLNAPGASFGNDGFFTVGEIVPDGTLYIVEGIGQAWACAKADYQAAAVVAFGAGRIGTVAKSLRKSYPAVRIVIVPDKGKEQDAESVAREIGGAWGAMPADKPTNYDANDLEAEYGSDALADLLRAAKSPPMRYRLQSADDVMNAPPQQWLVRDVIPAGGTVSVYGPSGSGKSFLVLDLCAALAEGSDWFGRRVASTRVVYVALEGETGLSKRAKAWSASNRRPLPDGLHFITQSFDVRDLSDVSDLVDAIRAGGGAGLLVIDTLNRAAPGADENSSKDMNEIITNLKMLQDGIGGTVLVVHHTGKDTTKGLRGHSSLIAALDAAIEVKRDDGRAWSAAKVKDGAEGERYAFALRVIDVGEDEDGEPVTSCVVAPDDSPVVVKPAKPSGKTQRLVYALMDVLLSESKQFGKAGAPSGRPCVEFEAVVPVIAERLLCRPDQREYQVRRALGSMAGDGKIYQMRDGWIWAN